MKRGDLVTIATSGDYGKPRPALILQSHAYNEFPSITVLPLTSADLATVTKAGAALLGIG